MRARIRRTLRALAWLCGNCNTNNPNEEPVCLTCS